MAIKIKPSAKPSPKAAPVTKTAPKDAEKAAEKAERETLIAEEAETLSSSVSEYLDSKVVVENKWATLADATRTAQQDNDLSKSEVQDLLRRAFAEAGGYEPETLTGKQAPGTPQASHAVTVSQLIKMAFPENERLLSKCLAEKLAGKSKFSNDQLLRCAREGTAPKAGLGKGNSAAARQNKQAEKDKAPFDSIEDFVTALAGILQGAEKSGFEDDDITTAIEDHLAEWVAREKPEAEKEE